MTFEDYKLAVEAAHRSNPGWRLGQAAFNVLRENRPDLSEQIRATKLDPFHSTDLTSILPKFYEWAEQHWSEHPSVHPRSGSIQ